ncbi:MAG: AIR synthase family protein [Candidatus Freyarchaeota archaeon]|nr:AIR synthase family protein [Candidatus Jordarchaeia archaeon]MBS7267325.1 AIR synthase family protein [Candidatus Jordarchaeia archaeon]MBS7281059.1 AIR synthase family protein [Candidatus Jordarchaeia archaeon]
MKLPIGKVPNNLLEKIVFPYGGVNCGRVICGPAVGQDAAVIDFGEKLLVVGADPITGTQSRMGWYAVHVNANDVAVRGAVPQFFTSTILLPNGADTSFLEKICRDIDEAAREVGVCVVGGHTEVVPYLENALLCGAMFGETTKERLVLTSGARADDVIIMTKHAGLEGAAILATDRFEDLSEFLNKKLLLKAKSFFSSLSVVREALAVNETGVVTSMHDPTEGGLLGGLIEMAEASNVGFRIEEELIPVAEETRDICSLLRIDPLCLISSGVLLVTVRPGGESKALEAIRSVGSIPTIIGRVTPSRRILVRRGGEKVNVRTRVREQLWDALRTKPS